MAMSAYHSKGAEATKLDHSMNVAHDWCVCVSSQYLRMYLSPTLL